MVFSAQLLALLVSPTLLHAQGAAPHGPDAELVPYHQHRDTRNGHDHSYPDRGSIIRDVPKTAIVVNYAGIAYRFDDGIWYEPRGPAFMVVAPPIGLMVSTLPTFSTVIARDGKLFLYSNDTYYVPRPDAGGYEVVNDPSDAPRDAATSAATAAPTGAAPSTPVFATPLLESAAATATPLPSAAAATPASSGRPLALAAGSTSAGVSTLAPAGVSGGLATDVSSDASKSGNAVIYPKNGQSPDQQARDRYECYRFGVAQSGFDPMHPAGGSRADAQADYERAQGVCLDAHGYSVH
jgi:hypothetical protein